MSTVTSINRNTATIAARRLGARVESPDELRDRLIRDEIVSQYRDHGWWCFFAGATFASFVAFAGWLLLSGWVS